MAARVPARLTRAEGRRFGLTVGGAFLVVAAVSWWRDHPAVVLGAGALGSFLVLAGLILPTHLGPVERAWMKLAHAISRITTPVVMAVLYFVIITPVAFLRRTLGANPLVHVEGTSGFWKQRKAGSRPGAMERQF